MNRPDPLGPWPGQSVAALTDLGLSDEEIARYYGVPPARVRDVNRAAAEDRFRVGTLTRAHAPRACGLRSIAGARR